MRAQTKKKTVRYDWVPHEVRREQAEKVVAYVLISVVLVALSLAVMVFALGRFSQ